MDSPVGPRDVVSIATPGEKDVPQLLLKFSWKLWLKGPWAWRQASKRGPSRNKPAREWSLEGAPSEGPSCPFSTQLSLGAHSPQVPEVHLPAEPSAWHGR